MRQIQIDIGRTAGFELRVGTWGELIINFGDLDLGKLISAIGEEAVLECIGIRRAIEYFEIEEAQEPEA